MKECKADTVCLRCSGNHNFKSCTINDKEGIKCVNCQGAHAACSRICPTMIKKENEIKNRINKKFNLPTSIASNSTNPKTNHQITNNQNTINPNITNALSATYTHSIIVKFLSLLVDIIS